MKFEWDAAKAASNFPKHDVTFEFATRIFGDEFYVLTEDRRYEYGEKRYTLLGKIEGRVYVVITTKRREIYRLISARKANDREKKNITQFVPDPKNPPKLPKAALKRLDAMGDVDIDYSDIPELDDEFWKNARILRPAPKKMMSLRVDEPVLKWFRKQGKGYQSYMNAVLRAFVESNSRT